MDANETHYERVLGAAVVRIWGELPRAIQEMLFELAVEADERSDGLREQLAIFLHNKHPRTEHHTP
jgi:hypothetical protein